MDAILFCTNSFLRHHQLAQSATGHRHSCRYKNYIIAYFQSPCHVSNYHCTFLYTPPLLQSISPFRSLQPRRLECIQLMYYFLHRLLSSSAILSKQWFLIPLPNNDTTTFIAISIIIWFVMNSCRYNDTDGVGIDTCRRDLGGGEDLLDAGDGSITFLGSPVSVSRLWGLGMMWIWCNNNMNKMRQWLVR